LNCAWQIFCAVPPILSLLFQSKISPSKYWKLHTCKAGTLCALNYVAISFCKACKTYKILTTLQNWESYKLYIQASKSLGVQDLQSSQGLLLEIMTLYKRKKIVSGTYYDRFFHFFFNTKKWLKSIFFKKNIFTLKSDHQIFTPKVTVKIFLG